MATTDVEMVIKECQPTDESEAAKISARLVNEFFEKSHKVLKKHKINRKRAAAGKLEADIILIRDAGHLLPKFFNINKKYGLKFCSLADMPVERGISRLAGMEIVVLPPPSKNLKEDSEMRVNRLIEVLSSYDCFYIHIKGPDEPGHDGNFDLKARLISIIDEYFLGKLLERIDLEKHILCVTSDHSTPCKMKTHSDDPVPILISGNKIQSDPVQQFSERECKKGSLGILDRGTELMPKLVHYMKTQ
jgi:2,3-bisphosphoglycerate-independent phosphoglycerate mutase